MDRHFYMIDTRDANGEDLSLILCDEYLYRPIGGDIYIHEHGEPGLLFEKEIVPRFMERWNYEIKDNKRSIHGRVWGSVEEFKFPDGYQVFEVSEFQFDYKRRVLFTVIGYMTCRRDYKGLLDIIEDWAIWRGKDSFLSYHCEKWACSYCEQPIQYTTIYGPSRIESSPFFYEEMFSSGAASYIHFVSPELALSHDFKRFPSLDRDEKIWQYYVGGKASRPLRFANDGMKSKFMLRYLSNIARKSNGSHNDTKSITCFTRGGFARRIRVNNKEKLELFYYE